MCEYFGEKCTSVTNSDSGINESAKNKLHT